MTLRKYAQYASGLAAAFLSAAAQLPDIVGLSYRHGLAEASQAAIRYQYDPGSAGWLLDTPYPFSGGGDR